MRPYHRYSNLYVFQMVVHLINRQDRPERLSHAKEQLSLMGFNARRFDAVIGHKGWDGCRDSHLALLEKNKNEPFHLVFEDDIEFIGNTFEETIQEAIRELSPDWDALYLGANPTKPQEIYSDHLYLLNGAYCTHAIIWHNRKGGAVEYMLEHKDEILKIDVFISSVLMPKFNFFLTRPMIITQHQFQSDTCRRSDVSQILVNYEKYCK
jgi:GR25 family glycosyltransferase involved in LPS biosynthesis